MFPGQGTQRAQMGLLWRATKAWAVIERAETALDQPLAHLLLDAPDTVLERTLEAQLAVFLQSLVAWEALSGELDEAPVAFTGHSLGQLTALVAAGVLSLEDGARLVAQRAAATQEAADRSPGRMAALIGAELEQAEAACHGLRATAAFGHAGGQAGADVRAWVANDNAPGQIVIGGTPSGVEAAGVRAQELGVRRVIPLNVGGAFHTPLFAPAADALRPVLAATPFAPPLAPVVSNVDAEPHTDPAQWPDQLARHLVSPVRWRLSLLTLQRLGADSLIEVGPGNVLAGLARRTLPGIPVRNVGQPDDLGRPHPLEVAS